MDVLSALVLPGIPGDPFPLAPLGRLLLAALLGGVVGMERELSGKSAGLRTNLLICLGAALVTETSLGVAAMANAQNAMIGAEFRADPGRIAAQIVTGIGFLGAGTILQSRGTIHGLTTAATIWVVAAIGMAVGARTYIFAITATIIVVVTLTFLGRLEDLLFRRQHHQRFSLRIAADTKLLLRVESIVRNSGLHVSRESIERRGDTFELTFELDGKDDPLHALFEILLGTPGVSRLTRS